MRRRGNVPSLSSFPFLPLFPATATATAFHHGRRHPLWRTVLIALCLPVLLPVCAVLWLSVAGDSQDIRAHLAATVLPGYVVNTLVLMFGVGVWVLVIGVGAAWLVTMYAFPGRAVFEWLLLLPLAVPAYLMAYCFTDLLEFSGPLQGALRALFGWSSARDYWFPDVRTLPGAIVVMGLVLYPYVYLMARLGFLELSSSLLESARTLGCGAAATFYKVALPLAWPSIVAGLALVCMETLSDYGAVDYFAVSTLSRGVFDAWLNMGSLGGAAQLSTAMLVFVVILIAVEKTARRHRRYAQDQHRYKPLTRRTLRGARAWLAFTACALPVAAGFLLPGAVLAYYALSLWDAAEAVRFLGYARNSVLLSALAGAVAVTLALLIAYARRLCGGPLVNVLASLTVGGYALPGAMLAIGVLIPLSFIDNRIDAWMEARFGIDTGLLLSGTIAALVLAFVVRFLAVASGAVESSLTRITPNMELAARSMGYAPFRVLCRFHLPVIRGGLWAGLLLVFVDAMKELPMTLVLRPFNFETLATYVYQYASDELLEQCAAGGLLIVAAGLIPVILLSRTMTGVARGGKRMGEVRLVEYIQ